MFQFGERIIILIRIGLKVCYMRLGSPLTLAKTTNSISKLKEFADDYLKFNKNVRKFSKRVKTVREKEKIRAISHFPNVFSKDLYCRT